MADPRSLGRRLEKLMKAGEWGQSRALIRALAEPSVSDALLLDTRWDDEDGLIAGRRFQGPGKSQPWLDALLRVALAAGPDEGLAGRVRRQVRWLVIPRIERPEDWAALACFSALERLVVYDLPGIEDLAPLVGLPALAQVELYNAPQLRDLSGLAPARLTLVRCPGVA